MTGVPFWEPAAQALFAGRDVILAGSVPAAWNDYARDLQRVGARRILVYATEGPGLTAGPDVPTVVVTQPGSPGLLERVRASHRLISEPPPEARAAIDEFDPHREALVVGSFLNESPMLAERPLLAHRRPDWVALEDKTCVDAIWDRAGVGRQPSRVVPIDAAAAAAADLDRGQGTVWAGDARDGYHGGAALTRWVHDRPSRAAAIRDLSARCDTVRVMPFVEGVACSIHAIVLPDGVVALRPVEMVTLRSCGALLYSGCATFWDPLASIREQMRDAARRTAQILRAEVGFRGTFTIDGIAATDGFWPTELNPRYGAGIGTIARATGMPLLLLHDMAVAGHTLGTDAATVERELLSAADAHRGGGTWLIDRQTARPLEPRGARFEDATWRWAEADELPDATFVCGADFARCAFEPDRTPVGPSAAPRAAAFWNFAGPQIYAGFEPVTAPPG